MDPVGRMDGSQPLRFAANTPVGDSSCVDSSLVGSRDCDLIRKRRRQVAILGLATAVIYALIAFLSRQFAHEIPGASRPIPLVVGLLGLAFVLYCLAWRLVTCRNAARGCTRMIVLFGIGFRVLLLFSTPIQEIDIYRYLWDGQVSALGVNPFRYSPREVQQAINDTEAQQAVSRRRTKTGKPAVTPSSQASSSHESDIARLIAHCQANPTVARILSRVHFAELPTVYPPVSQVIFVAATVTTPALASIQTRLVLMKAWILLFDMATFALLIALLRHVKLPTEWSIAYGWCPLVMKEFANSGHLDAIAVCLTVLAIYVLLRSCRTATGERSVDGSLRHSSASSPDRNRFVGIAVANVVLALAVGAKLYPVVLVPLFLLVILVDHGWKIALASLTVFAVSAALIFAPVFVDLTNSPRSTQVDNSLAEVSNTATINVSGGTQTTRGWQAFLSRWEINDFLFLILVENLRPDEHIAERYRPWFVVVPNDWRNALGDGLAEYSDLTATQAPFLVARGISAMVLVAVVLWLSWRGARSQRSVDRCRATFLILAWFWLLAPTQNPWYWTWALPFLPFARGRAWMAVSGLVLLYYLRFWLGYHWPTSPVLSTTYPGTLFFDFVVTWLEFGPWMVWLIVEGLYGQPGRKTTPKG